MKQAIIIVSILFLLTSCFKKWEVNDLVIEENSAIWEQLTIELGWISSWSWNTNISDAWVSPLNF
jgi:hypothetical protein